MNRFMRTNSGSAQLLTVLIAGSIGVGIFVFIGRLISNSVQAQRHLALKNDVESLRRHFTESLDCNETLREGNLIGTTTASPIDMSAGNDCMPGSGVQKILTAKDKNGRVLTNPLETTAGPFQNTGKVGDWSTLLECDRTNGTLVVRAARKLGAAGFAEDPLTKRTYDFTTGNSMYLFGGNKGKLCASQFGGVSELQAVGIEQVENTTPVIFNSPGQSVIHASYTHMAKGEKLLVSLSGHLWTKGSNRSARVNVRRFELPSATFLEEKNLLHLTGVVDIQSIALTVSNEFLYDVTPNTSYRFDLKYEDSGSGPGETRYNYMSIRFTDFANR